MTRLSNLLVWGGATIMFAAYPAVLLFLTFGMAKAYVASFCTMYAGGVAIYCGLRFEPLTTKSV